MDVFSNSPYPVFSGLADYGLFAHDVRTDYWSRPDSQDENRQTTSFQRGNAMFRTAKAQRTKLKVVLVLGILLAASIFVSFVQRNEARAAGTTYYVATSGNDNNNGTSTSSPFQHIQKCASLAVAGDTCLIEGGTYHETVTPAHSGTSSAPITFRPYNGQVVTVDGADPVTGWSRYQNNIYAANVTLPISTYNSTGFFANQVFVSGQMMMEARWPNSGSNLMQPTQEAITNANSSYNTLYDTNLPNIDWTGAIIHVSGPAGWTSETGTITASSTGSVTFTWTNHYHNDCFANCPGKGDLYYLTGKLAALDSANEWYYDGTAHKLYLWAPTGNSPIGVEAKQRNYAFDLGGLSYINVNNVSIFSSTIFTNASSTQNVLNGIDAQYVSHFQTLPDGPNPANGSACGIYCTHQTDSGIILDGSNETLENSTIAYSAGNGIAFLGANLTVTNNLIHDTDYMGAYDAGIRFGNTGNGTITHNTLYNTGREEINGNVSGTYNAVNTIAYNDIHDFSYLQTDDGGVYFCCGNVDGNGTSIDHNWVHGAHARNGNGNGIYIDNSAKNFLIHHNVVWSTQNRAITINGYGGDNSSDGNLIYNNTMGLGLQKSIGGKSNVATGTRIINNIFSQGSTALEKVGTGADIANNLMPTNTSTLFTDTTNNDYHLKPAALAIDQGQVIVGITNGYVGSAPDEGAYEYGGTDWIPGCNLSNCGTNFALNGGFESGILNSWCTGGGAYCTNVTVTSSSAHSGTYAAKLGGLHADLEQYVAGLLPNTSYTLTAWGKVATSGEQLQIGVKAYSGSAGVYQTLTSTSYTQVTVTFTTGATNTSARITLYKTTGSGAAYGDDYTLTPTAS